VFAFTLGSVGENGRGFLEDLQQATLRNIGSAFLGGIIFNAANILLSSAIAIAGMAVAFPVGIGIALVLGVIVNYYGAQQGDPQLLFTGVGLIMGAIIINAIAYKRTTSGTGQKVSTKGLVVSILAGILMSFFYRFIASTMDLENFSSPAVGLMTPYTAVVIFSLGIFVSNFLFNTILFRNPISGPPTSYREYFNGRFSTHLVGVLGGLIWGIGNSFNLIAAGKAGAAVSYGLGQGATLVAAVWGVFVWKEFKNGAKEVSVLLGLMFLLFLAGIISIIYAGQ
jgi:glucose uptake protein